MQNGASHRWILVRYVKLKKNKIIYFAKHCAMQIGPPDMDLY